MSIVLVDPVVGAVVVGEAVLGFGVDTGVLLMFWDR